MGEGMDLNKFSLCLDGGWAVRYPLGPAGGDHVGVWAFTLMGSFGLINFHTRAQLLLILRFWPC